MRNPPAPPYRNAPCPEEAALMSRVQRHWRVYAVVLPRVLLNNSASPDGGGVGRVGGSDIPHPPPLGPPPPK